MRRGMGRIAISPPGAVRPGHDVRLVLVAGPSVWYNDAVERKVEWLLRKLKTEWSTSLHA